MNKDYFEEKKEVEKTGRCFCGNTEFKRATVDIIIVTKTKGAYTDEFCNPEPSDDDFLTCTKCGIRYVNAEQLIY